VRNNKPQKAAIIANDPKIAGKVAIAGKIA